MRKFKPALEVKSTSEQVNSSVIVNYLWVEELGSCCVGVVVSTVAKAEPRPWWLRLRAGTSTDAPGPAPGCLVAFLVAP